MDKIKKRFNGKYQMKGTVIIEQARGFFAKNPILTYILIGGILAFIIYKWGQKQGEDTVPILPQPIPKPPGGEGTDNFYNPGPLTDRLSNEIIGIAWTPRDRTPFDELLKIPDWQFIAVANDWQKRYYNKAGKLTLLQAINNESSGWGYFLRLKEQIAERGQKLGLV